MSYPATPALNVTYTWDGVSYPLGVGHVTHYQDAAGKTDLYYDQAGRVTSEVRTFGTTAYTTTYTWDNTGTGKLIYEQLPSGYLLNFGYDAMGRVNAVSVASGWSGSFQTVATAMSYFPFGEVRGITFGNNLTKWQNDDLEYKIDGLFLTPPSGSALITRYHSFGDNLNPLEPNNDTTDPATSQFFTLTGRANPMGRSIRQWGRQAVLQARR